MRVFAEGVVIVASILLAFGIDAWWEGRREREQEEGVLTTIYQHATPDKILEVVEVNG